METRTEALPGMQSLAYELPTNERKAKYKDVPIVVAPGREEEYLALLRQEKEREEYTEVVEKVVETTNVPQDNENKTIENHAEVGKAPKSNENGWGDFLNSFGLDSLGNIGQNLGYVISMLPDILFGLFTGKSKSLLSQNNLLPIASILAGMYVRNPMLKMILVGMGGMNLLNKAGKEALERQEHKTVQPYKAYADEILNSRITTPVLQGNSLIAAIDKVPCSIQLPENVVDAHRSGVLPLNTLANAVLAKHDEMRQMAQQNYRAVETEQHEDRERTVILK